ncbi:MAG: TatD family hydrolase [Elusimicrobia bacterium]|nr:TatD family hydrolase [Elusimicrobiota bacterium]
MTKLLNLVDENLVFDSHAHLLDKRISMNPHVLDGVGGVICFYDPLGDDVNSFNEILKNSKVIGAAGIHPHYASDFHRLKNELLMSLELKKVMVLGEIGLDYYRDNSPRKQQRRAFIEQLKLAEKLKLPVAVHTREAFRDTMDILNEYAATRVLIHCFSEGPKEALEAVKQGCFVAFGGTLTYPGSKDLRMAAEEVPYEKLLVETDSPYLAPQPVRGRTNIPWNVRYTIETLSYIKKTTPEKIARETFKATLNFLGLEKHPNEKTMEERND